MGEQIRSLAHEVIAPAKQIAGGAHRLGVNVRLREHTAAQQHGDLVGVDLVVFGFAAVDGFHVEGVAEDEGDAFLGAQVREPVPGEDALDGDDEVVAVRGDGVQEGGRFGFEVAMQQDLALAVQDAQIH